jgi:hypothetical protein
MEGLTMPFGFLGLESPIHFLIIGLLFGFWIWMLVDCLKNRALRDTEKLIWVLVIVLLNWLGAVVYFFVARSKRA